MRNRREGGCVVTGRAIAVIAGRAIAVVAGGTIAVVAGRTVAVVAGGTVAVVAGSPKNHTRKSRYFIRRPHGTSARWQRETPSVVSCDTAVIP